METTPETPPEIPARGFAGEIVYLFAYDIAYELGREPIATLLGHPVAVHNLDASRRGPRHLLFYKPQLVRLPPQDRVGPHGTVRVEREVRILPIGAIGIRVRVPFRVSSLAELVAYHDLEFGDGILHQEVRQLAESIRQELAPLIVRPIVRIAEEEAYTVFCFRGPLTGAHGEPIRAEAWLESHRREIAAVLTQEQGHQILSRQEAIESTARHLSYYEDDLAVIDWDAALVVDHPSEWEETLYVLELANLQLTELEAYDRILDSSLERTYRDLGAAVRGRSALIRELRELRMDLTRFNDELSNITKFFGDWHVARVYETVSSRFHLGDWHRSVDAKLRAVADLHELLKHDQMNRWMMILEVTIVLLFVIDLAILFAGLKH